MRITVLNENTVYKKRLLGEHGLSFIIEYKDKKLLMDTGQSDVFIKNAETLGVNLDDLDGIIISHGHYDHGGGLKYIGSLKNIPSVFVNKKALISKYSTNYKNGKFYFNGIDYDSVDCIKDNIVYTKDTDEIFKDMYLVSNIPCSDNSERVSSRFFLKDNNRFIPDFMKDEQVFVIDTKDGLALFAGCAHVGIMNIINYVKEIFSGKSIYLLFGGMHLINVDAGRIEQTTAFLKKENIRYIMPCHCTGYTAAVYMAKELKDNFVSVECGKILEI
ncbi:MBL fold metallo-hydrolase [Anaerofustis sp.]|uniref:MBL fold metallo-hydrolase n=1 Tax=Anaerofustis sp. TaxID=1872517 RepID=UPI0025BEDF54|nr:MBL fold metallo-hydrolase [Anaerofustis sp.]